MQINYIFFPQKSETEIELVTTPDGRGVDGENIDRRGRFLGPQFEGSLKEPLGLGSGTRRVVCHDPDPIVSVWLQANDEGVGVGGA